jgi:branched-chain amino acid transport system substrate-binding protein
MGGFGCLSNSGKPQGPRGDGEAKTGVAAEGVLFYQFSAILAVAVQEIRRMDRRTGGILAAVAVAVFAAGGLNLTASLTMADLRNSGVQQVAITPGVTDTEIKIGNIVPYTGVFAEYGATGKAEAGYFRMINERGGVNGRKINFISVDSGSDWKTAPEQARKLIEEDKVLLLFGNFGYPGNKAIRAYMNEQKIPQLFIASNDSLFDDPAQFPWTMGFAASKRTESLVYAKYILKEKPNAKIAILYPEDASGTEWRDGIHDGLGDKAASLIVKEASFAYSYPAGMEAKIAELKASGADVFFNFTVGKFTTQVIRKAYELDWHPTQFIPNASISVAAFLEPAGLQKSTGIITNARSKGWTSERAQEDPAVREFVEWMAKYDSDANTRDANVVFGYEAAQVMVAVLQKCGNDLSRANVMKQAASLDLQLGMLMPGIRVTTSPTDYRPIKQLYLVRFDGKYWMPFGDVISD